MGPFAGNAVGTGNGDVRLYDQSADEGGSLARGGASIAVSLFSKLYSI